MRGMTDDPIGESIAVVADQFSATVENTDLRGKLQALQQAASIVISKWRNFDEPTLEQRKMLYDAYIKSGGKVS